jgi:hypothetical protein
MQNRNLYFIAPLFFIAIACGHGKPAPKASVQYPDWVNRGGGLAVKDGASLFLGVGEAPPEIKEARVRVNVADGRARKEVSRVVQEFIAVLTKDWTYATVIPDGTAENPEAAQQAMLDAFAGDALTSVTIEERWQDPATGTLYALARLDLRQFLTDLDKNKTLNATATAYIRENAARLFGRLLIRQ